MDSIFVFIFGPLESVESNSKESALGVRATSAGWGRGARRQAEGLSSDSWNPVKRRVPWAPGSQCGGGGHGRIAVAHWLS